MRGRTFQAFVRLAPAEPTSVFDTYWRFAAERQGIFFRRIAGELPPWTKDRVLAAYRFTNVYRASDRVTQFLIKEVIYKGDQNLENAFFRIILFKLFNRIETWELLREQLGELDYVGFDIRKYDSILTKALKQGKQIYSAAYIMPSGGRRGHARKHRDHLGLLQMMMQEELPARIAEARSMKRVFELLRSFPMVGDFLAYQFLIDINYSTIVNFSEMEFVMPGPGARSGIKKCFGSLGGLNEADIIRMVADRQEEEFERLGLQFRTLWGRRLQLIDCQNLFCEVDKYARVAHPEVMGTSRRHRIKHRYRPNPKPIEYWFPPKWGLSAPLET